jgi:hypothetical protein
MPDAAELQRLLASRFDWEHAPIEDKPDREKLYNELFDVAYRESLATRPQTSKHTFRDAIDKRYRTYRADRRRREMGSIPPAVRGN